MPQEINYSSKWGEFVQSSSFDTLPAEVVNKMKRSLLDIIGVTVSGSRNKSCQILLSYLKSNGGTPQSTIIPDGTKTNSYNAALAMGTYAHSTEMAEVASRGVVHPGNTVPPAAIAVAEREKATGKELITALAVGFEINIRAGFAARVEANSPVYAAKDEYRETGAFGSRTFWHFPATYGVYGSTAAACKLMELDSTKTARAFTLAGSLVPAIGGSLLGGGGRNRAPGMSKDLWEGLSCAIGTLAADLASQGFTGPSDVTHHFYGTVPDYSPSELIRGLGKDYLVLKGALSIKIHNAAGPTRASADATLAALEKQAIKPEQIESIEVRTVKRGKDMSLRDVPDEVAARLSIPYVVSAIITFHEDVKKDPYFRYLYTEDKISDERRRTLARKIEVIPDDEYDRFWERDWPMKYFAKATIKLKSGKTISAETETWTPTSHMSNEQVIDKFKNVTQSILTPSKMKLTVEKAMNAEKLAKVSDLVQAACL
jgi:2-methylcitrate dehydratase PrpD